MGQARKRGTFEERKQQAIDNAPKPLSDKDRADITAHIKKLTVMEKEAGEKATRAYLKRSRLFERVMHSAATPGELKGE